MRYVVMTAVLLTASPSAAQPREPGALLVDDFVLIGVGQIDESALRRVLATREAPWLPWRDRTRFDPQGLELDLRRIVAYYRDQGFADARVVSHGVHQLNPIPGLLVDGEPQDRRWRVHFSIGQSF
jgi:hypothetical protein